MHTLRILNLLPFLALTVLASEDTRVDPVDVLQIKNVLIENYEGSLKPDTLQLFPNIEHLEFKHNNFTIFNADFLRLLPNLQTLKIAKNAMKEVEFNATGCCGKLESIELEKSGIGGRLEEALKQIGTIKSLKYISLADENLPVLREDVLVNPNLEELSIYACDLETIEDGAFKKLQQLKTLELRVNRLGWINKEVFAPLTNIRKINLDQNRMIQLTTDMLPPLPNLEVLIVSFNNLHLLDLEGVKNVAPKLKTVDIGGFVQKGGMEIKSGGVHFVGFVIKTRY
ncbi:P-granule-associated novel protein 1-like [Coccinella septempunctata]|uniref:P-granule-associated novel protein 1-like n=1 Tax=Coccinella septempunctata TaxID=41139 RepID=UPI001D07129E|nr:P-granule-associated novel protein 1-like [Coccinella septempunctata]